jgi:Mg-chelatase subunit ChlD
MNTTIVPGSMADIAQRENISLAESFLTCDVLVLIDQSGSMAAHDAPGGLSRFDAAQNELSRLQRENPGRVAVVEFSNTVRFCPGGVPSREGAMTDMAAALRFAKVVDGASQIVLISDGLPDSQNDALAVARTYTSPIHTIYIGSERDTDGGRAFLQRLAAACGGRSFQSDAPGLLGARVEQLLLA